MVDCSRSITSQSLTMSNAVTLSAVLFMPKFVSLVFTGAGVNTDMACHRKVVSINRYQYLKHADFQPVWQTIYVFSLFHL